MGFSVTVGIVVAIVLREQPFTTEVILGILVFATSFSFCSTSYFLPPANVVCEGYVFTRVCHSVHGGVCSREGLVLGGAWSGGGGGWYASYWNAFLFLDAQLLKNL